MFGCVGWCGEVRYALRREEWAESNELSTIIRIKVSNFGFEFRFCKWFEGNEYSFDLGLFSKREHPSIPSEVVN